MESEKVEIVGLDHVQIAMPPGGEGVARLFYGELLGLAEIEKPQQLKSRGGCWFEGNGVQVHLGVEINFIPAHKAHPAFLVADLADCEQKLAAAGVPWVLDETLPGRRRGHIFDPFGNRIELIQDGDGFGQNR